MAEGRGRGRAALFGKSAAAPERTDTPPIGRGRAPECGDAEAAPKPRGRGALFRPLVEEDSKTHVSGSSSGSSGYDMGTLVTGSTGPTSGESSASDGSRPRSGMGRAALFGLKPPSSTGSTSDVTSSMQGLSVSSEHSSSSGSSSKKDSAERGAPVMKHGMSGKRISASANYLRLEIMNKDQGIYEYEVRFKPEVDDFKARSILISQNFRNAGGKVKVFDGGFRLFSPDKLPDDIYVGNGTLRSGLEVEVKFVYKRVKKLDDCKSILNNLIKRIMFELKLVKFGRSDFNPEMAHKIPEYKLEVWPGCITAITEHEGGLLLNCDASHRVLRSNTVLELIKEIALLQRDRPSNSFEADVTQALVGMSVITNYNKKIMKIDDVDFKMSPRSTFTKGEEEISFIQYYKQQYNIDIRDAGQPLLVHRAKRKPMGREKEEIVVCLIPELCSPCGLTDEMRSNFRLMKSVSEFTRLTPTQRQDALRKFVQGIRANQKANQHLLDWGLKLPDTTIDIPARVLEPETIHFGRGRTTQEPNADWGRAAGNNPMLSPIDLTKWAIIFTARDNRVANKFMETFREIGRKVGMNVDKPAIISINNDQARLYCDEIKRLGKIQIVVIIFPSQRDDRYSSVKKLCNVDLGLPSQVIISRTLMNDKSLRSVVTKIVLQMTCKVGGSLWGVQIPFKEEGIMFCGIDAYHEAGRRSQSVVALVSSINSVCTRFTSGTASHNKGQEISDMITNLLKENMEQWHKVNGNFPSRIVMFRDGVGDGQLATVRDFEIPQFTRLFTRIHSDYKPKLTYVVVQKRINTRIYTKMNGKFDNPPPGTIVDHTITRRDWYDFFLVSQNVRQGTVAPTHYVVVYDDSDMTVDTMQKITYKMTHLYYNWNGTVRVPAPCQYAHKLAYLVGQFVHAPANKNLQNLLYFL